MAFLQEWQADIRVSIDGTPIADAWATYNGAVLTVQDGHTRPGGMGHEVSTGGPASRSDCTVTTQLTEALAALHPTLEAKYNKRVKITITEKDSDRNPIPGTTFSVTGTLKQADKGNADAGSNAQRYYTVITSCDEIAAS